MYSPNILLFSFLCINVLATHYKYLIHSCSLQFSSPLFPPTTGGAQALSEDCSVPLVGQLPLDPRIARHCDEGTNFLQEEKESPAAKAYQRLAARECKVATRCQIYAWET